jgi:hypothetical protein
VLRENMLTKQVPNSDILSLLGASGKGAGEKPGAGIDGILGSKLSAFSLVVKTFWPSFQSRLQKEVKAS